MNGETDEPIDETDGDGSDDRTDGGRDTLIDVLSGDEIPASPKKRLVQKVLRQLIGSYGFDRADIRVGYRLTTQGRRGKTVDIVILRHGREALDEHVERVIVCQRQKRREKLRSPQEAEADLRKLHEPLQSFPDCRLGMWTNGQEVFFVRVEDTTFETRFIDIGAWPAPGEQTDAVLREGGVTQVAADPEDLEAALGGVISTSGTSHWVRVPSSRSAPCCWRSSTTRHGRTVTAAFGSAATSPLMTTVRSRFDAVSVRASRMRRHGNPEF